MWSGQDLWAVCEAHLGTESRNGALWSPAHRHEDISPKKTYLRRCPAEGTDAAWNWRPVLCPGGKTPRTSWESWPEKSSSWLPGHRLPLSCGSRDSACVESQLLCACLAHQRQQVTGPREHSKVSRRPGSRGKAFPPGVNHTFKAPLSFQSNGS